MIGKKILLAENNSKDLSFMSDLFIKLGHRVSRAYDGLSAFEKITRDHYDLIMTELNLPNMGGIDLLRKAREVNGRTPIVLISGKAGVNEAVTAMKLGAYDFILKPLTMEMIELIISQISNNSHRQARPKESEKYNIITKNGEMSRLLREAKDMACSQASIFIQGESGTGKELFARYIHRYSNRKDNPFVAINCSALPETLLESELFGHEKGSFTGALSRKKGKFEIANYGTMLLDEISEMDVRLQSKLLRVLQEKEIDRIGGARPIPVDVRIIATTNRDIEQHIKDGKFREDLFYRLNVVPFHLPPLRERRDDIELLTEYFIKKYNSIDNRNIKGLTQEALGLLMQMQWKGNVRELENVIERAVLMCKEDLIGPENLFAAERNGKNEDILATTTAVPLREMEKKAIFHALDRTNGNRTHAAEILGISVRTLRNKLNEYRKKMEMQ
jgi:two-component system response regulator FlrC